MILRAARADDLDALAAVHAACFPAPWPAVEIAAVLTSPGVFSVIAQAPDGGEIAGFVLSRTLAGEAEILTLAVAPHQRRAGLGRALLEAAAQLAHGAGAQTLFLEVAADNPPAIGLYASAGFDQAGLRRGYYAKGRAAPVDALVYRRALNSGLG